MKTSSKNSSVNTDRKRTQRTHSIEKCILADLYEKPLSNRQRKKQRHIKHIRERQLKTIEHCKHDGIRFAKDNKSTSKFDNRQFHVCHESTRERNGEILDTPCQNIREVTFDDKYKRHTVYSNTTKRTYNLPSKQTSLMENAYNYARKDLPNARRKYTKQIEATNRALARVTANGKMVTYSIG